MKKNENSFRNEAINIARYFDSIGDEQLAEYIMGLIAESNMYTPQSSDFESDFLKQIDTRIMDTLNLPTEISEDVKGIINAVNHNVGINKFLFEGLPGSGKTEAAKHVARLLNRTLFCVDFDNLIDSKLGQTNKNISSVFNEINMIPHANKVVILFDEIEVIALDRINSNDVREMGRVTSTILRELDRLTDLNKEIVIIATTNLFSNFDKALIRRFDAVINFNRYSKEDLIEVAEFYFSSFVKNFKGISKDIRLFRKILTVAEELPYHESTGEVYPKAMINYEPSEEKGYRATEIYYAVKEVNEEVLAIDHIFLRYKWQGCKVVRTSREKNIRLVKGGYEGGCITDVKATRDLLIGCFTHEEDQTEGYWIVNAQNPYRYEMNDVELCMEGAERLLYYRKGKEYDVPLQEGQFRVRLGVGEGIFVIPYGTEHKSK